MVIGPSSCGKTTLVNAVNDYNGKLKRTQDMIYGKRTIDVPGSYIENGDKYKHIIAAAQDASHVLILMDRTRRDNLYSPGFARLFKCPVIGVITKCDLMPENEINCVRQLKLVGVIEPYFHISFNDRVSIEKLKNYLFDKREEEGGKDEIYYWRVFKRYV